MFTTASTAKYAYLYVAQPLKKDTASFCLACIGTNNKFTAQQVLQRWDYIYTELTKRGVKIVSFAADGGSRLIRAMRVTSTLSTTDSLLPMDINRCLNCTEMPAILNSWTCTKTVPSLLCVQDIVHIAVKLKARILKPSIVLPLGIFLATSSHFQMLVKLYGKDQHGLRARDLDHRDKQNFDVVGHIINASQLLNEIPDAVGTTCYVNVMRSGQKFKSRGKN